METSLDINNYGEPELCITYNYQLRDEESSSFKILGNEFLHAVYLFKNRDAHTVLNNKVLQLSKVKTFEFLPQLVLQKCTNTMRC